MSWERRASACFLVAIVAALAMAVVYWNGGQPQLEGIFLAATSGGIGTGIIIWAQAATPHDEVEEAREPLASSDAEVDALTSAVEATDTGFGRRRLFVLAGGALAAFGAALLFPIRSLGPRPGRDLKRTPYRAGGLRIVREDGTAVRPDDLPVDGVITVWPEGHTDAADAPTLLIRTRSGRDFVPREGREGWTVEGIVAYSKLCTHVGCPVGLYQAEAGLLLCPCHQSTFDVYDGARPVFGPAARSLPQLPLEVDGDGFLVATTDFSSPVGPGFWDRDR